MVSTNVHLQRAAWLTTLRLKYNPLTPHANAKGFQTWLMLRSDFTPLRRYVGLLHLLFLLSLHRSPCTIGSSSVSVYNTICRRSLYNINLRATDTTILSIRGVMILIYLVSSTTDSIRRSVVLFKPALIPTSDPKSEFLCQLSSIALNLWDSPEPPRTPGISPTPSSPRITLTVILPVL